MSIHIANTGRARILRRSIDVLINPIVKKTERGLSRIQDEVDTLVTGYKLAKYLIHDAERRHPSKYESYENKHSIRYRVRRYLFH